ncbi:endo-1,4-beta-xylanase, partial [Paenibacillus thailandensis]
RDGAGGSIEATTDDNHTASGTKSLKTTVSTQYNGPILDVMGKMHKGHKYRLSAWVKMAAGQTPTSLRISVQSGDSTFANVSPNVTATDGQWVELAGDFTLATTPAVLKAYVETAQKPEAPVTFYMDDFVISYLGAVGAPKPIQHLIPIQDVYKDDFLIGNAVNSTEFDGDLRYELLMKHHNVVTAENAMKPDYAYDSNKNFDFTAEDALVKQIQDAGLLLHGHVLIWHQQTPAWLTTENGSPLSREAALANMRKHITTVMEHFGDKVVSWDVVNEAINDGITDPSDYKAALRNSPWKMAIGDDYVEQAFLIAREVLDAHPDWNIKLYYNDYNEDNQNKATAIYNMVKDINDRYAAAHNGKLLIDGVGMQAHYNLNTKPENVQASLEKFISLGVTVSVSELDVQAGSDSTITEQQAIAQAYLYARLFQIYKAHADKIERVTFWGLNDASSWRKANNPLLFDGDLQAKPAYYGVIDPAAFIADHPPASANALQASANYGTPAVDGEVDEVWSQAAALPVNRYQSAWQGATGEAKALWDDQYLYVLMQVSDTQLDKASVNAWEQDSIEVFLDQNNDKSFSYQADDGQYRVNFDNETSFNPSSKATGFVSATKVSGTNYTVELKIPFTAVAPANGTKLGFDVQVNDAKDGARQSVAAWNDTTGTGYQDTSVYGILNLIGKKPAVPTGLTAETVNASTVKLSWNAVEGAAGYNVYRSGSTNGEYVKANSAVVTSTQFSNTGLAAGTAYSFKVTAVNESGESVMSAAVSAKTNSAGGNTGGNTDGNAGGNTGNNTGTSPSDIMVKPGADGNANVQLQAGDVTEALEKATNGQLAFNVKPESGTLKGVTVEIPVQPILSSDKVDRIAVNVGGVSVSLSTESTGGMVNSGSQKVSLSIAQVDPSTLPAGVKEQVQGYPVYEFNLTVDGRKVSEFKGNKPVIVEMDYQLKPGEKANQIVVCYIGDNGELVVVKNVKYDAGTGKITFRPKHFSRYAAAYAKVEFDDLGKAAWAQSFVETLASREIIEGTGAGKFEPARAITRGEFLQLLMSALELIEEGASSSFTDAKAGAWYYDAVATAEKLGIVKGKNDGTFGVNDRITREEMAVMAYRAATVAKVLGTPPGSQAAFTDEADISAYAADAVKAMRQSGILNGVGDGSFHPKANASRAEAAAIMFKLLGFN